MRHLPLLIGIVLAGGIGTAAAQTVTVTGTVALTTGPATPDRSATLDASGAVVWLKPLGPDAARPAGNPRFMPRQHFAMVQQRKQFSPHVLVVPVGSVVDFPNLDPFFHNVFSMFDGKRFDLGLYEAGASHAVTFDAPGICYVFCNIHPEMSAAIVALDVPYYATTNRSGAFSIPSVPVGRYVLSVWHERAASPRPEGYPREVVISVEHPVLAAIRLADAGRLLAAHKNKYGRDYDPAKPYSPVRK